MVAHASEISDILSNGSLDLLAITETWLHEAAGPTLMLAVPDSHHILRADRPKAKGGGLAIIAKNTLPIRLANSPPCSSCEVLTAKLLLSNNRTLTIHLIYRPPGPLETFEEDLISLIANNTQNHSQNLLMGDFNIGFNDPDNKHAHSITALLNDHGLSQKVLSPTHIKGRTLDWVSELNCNITVTDIVPQPWTDHYLINFTASLDLLIPKTISMIPSLPTRSKKDISAEKLIPLLLPTINGLENNTDPDTLVDTFNLAMTKALDTIAPTKLCKSKQKAHLNAWFTPQLNELRKQKRKLQAIWHNSPTDNNKAKLAQLSKRYKKEIINIKNNLFDDRITKVQSNTKELFSILREMESPIKPVDTVPTDKILSSRLFLHPPTVDPPALPPLIRLSFPSLQINLPGFHYLQAMRFAIQEINNSSALLPGITLGYTSYDSCYIYNNIQPALDFISRDGTIDIRSHYATYMPRVIAVIGPDNIDAAVATSNIFNVFLLPQINYYAPIKALSGLDLPSCFQTIPSVAKQQKAIQHILTAFKWTWIAALGTADDYGKEGLQELYNAAPSAGICIGYQAIIPKKEKAYEIEWEQDIIRIVKNITTANVNVIVVFGLDIIAVDFFKFVVNTNLTNKVWIATEAWSVAKNIYNIPNISRLGVVFGIAIEHVEIPGFNEYLKNLIKDYQSGAISPAKGSCNQDCSDCLNATVEDILGPPESRVCFNVYSAVYAIAHALHETLACTQNQCTKRTIYPWQVTEALKHLNFSLINRSIRFDRFGDSAAGFDIVFWDWNASDGGGFLNVGAYKSTGHLQINAQKIKWNTINNTIPVSQCSPECSTGQEKIQLGVHTCCFTCYSCAPGTYLHLNGSCAPCSADQWSLERSVLCYNKTKEFLEWTSPLAIPLVAGVVLGMLLTFVMMVAFAINFQSPVVKAAGGRMTFIMLAALATAYISVLAFIGQPTVLRCILRHPIYSTALAVCFSYIAVKSFQIVCIFKMAATLPKTYDYWVKRNGQYVCVWLLSGVQLVISCGWVIYSPPEVIWKSINRNRMMMDCSEFSSAGHILQFSYNGLLSMLCFVFSYMGKELPKNYSEARCITFAMLVYFAVCVSFFTLQIIQVPEYITPINATLALVSLFGIMGGYFFPKCYVIFWKPEHNTAQHFQTAIQSYTKRKSGSSRR
ncbi:taste receptor type 1 member 2 [Ambystoma mexicanum]|uniref:taste receptor type 1 member 2 n=1 Tax=Ambystoma mexicanum TaxID=8296 RepID=UPI0037E924D7